MTTITKATSRGQITLPKKWRDKFKTDHYTIKADDFKVEIIPIDAEELEWANAETIFNAGRDNNGKGIKAEEFIKILRSIDKDGQNKKTSRKNLKKRQAKN